MLAVIESGCCERLERPLTILDYDAQEENFIHRIESLNEKQRYEQFCRFFRDDSHVKGGDNACKNWDISQGGVCLREFQKTKEPFRMFRCHMGLVDVTHVIQIRNRPVALVFSGQYQPPEGNMNIQRNVQMLGSGTKESLLVSDTNRKQLIALTNTITPLPTDIYYQVEREAKHIEKIAEAEFERSKRQREQEFLDELRRITNMTREINLEILREKLQLSLQRVMAFCGTKYIVLFSALREDDTVLMPFAKAGISDDIENLPHFNWSKAKLPLSNFVLDHWDIMANSSEAKAKGIRGNNRDYFENNSCAIPFASGDRYRSVLVFGEFSEQVDLSMEHSFLAEIARILGMFSSASLELLYLEQEKRRWKNTAKLLNHEVKTALTPITTRIGHARSSIRKKGNLYLEKADLLLKEAEDLALLLGRATNGTLDGADLRVEYDDLDIESSSLSTLVENCAIGFLEAARNRDIELIVDHSINTLPYADIDVARLTIALANLIENAIKYSFAEAKIYLRSHLNMSASIDRTSTVIEVDNVGLEIREDEREHIFELGSRGSRIAKIKKYPGSGYGLWEARSIIEAHGGQIVAHFWPTTLLGKRATRVVFSVELPLRHKKQF